MPPPFGPDNPWWEGFETDPLGQRANYFRFAGQQRSPNQKKWFESQFQDVQDKYLGLLGQQVTGGGQPSQTWTGFLDEYFGQGGGAQQDYSSLTPRQRGAQQGRFAPPARYMFSDRF